MATIETSNKYYKEELRYIYNAEGQVVKTLPKMVKAASNEELKKAFAESND